MDHIEVKVGQIWEDCDSRAVQAGIHRRLMVVEIIDVNGVKKAVCQHPRGGQKTKIRLDRFKPSTTGYKLIS